MASTSGTTFVGALRLRSNSFAILCSLVALLYAQPASGIEQEYKAAREKFSSDLLHAKTMGIGIASYEKWAQEADLEETQTKGAGLARLLALELKLRDQVAEIDRGGFGSIGGKIHSNLWRGLKHSPPKYWGTSIEFTVDKDSRISDFRWLKKSKSSMIDRELVEVLSQMSLRKRSPNQSELPIKVRLEPSLYSYLTVYDPSSGKERYRTLVKFPCFKKYSDY